METVSRNRSGKQSSPYAQYEQRWGNNLFGRIFLSLPFVGATVWVLIDEWITGDNWTIREMWPTLLGLGILTVMVMRPIVGITADELVIRIILTRRIPRAEVESAKFNYHGLVIRRRDGGTEFALLQPKMTSTELSWGVNRNQAVQRTRSHDGLSSRHPTILAILIQSLAADDLLTALLTGARDRSRRACTDQGIGGGVTPTEQPV
jgi:hypothetical protein